MSTNSLLNLNVLNKLSSSPLGQKKNTHLKYPRDQIVMDVEFGVLSKNCQNYGICRIVEEGSLSLKKRANKIRKKPGAICIFTSAAEGQMEMAFPKSKMDLKTSEKYFGNGTFTIQEDVIHVFDETQQIKNAKLHIKQGKYPVIETLGFYILQFPA